MNKLIIATVLFFANSSFANSENLKYYINVEAKSASMLSYEPIIEKPTLEQILSKADVSGIVRKGMASYPHGTFWLNNSYIAGASHVSSIGDKSIFVIVTESGHIISYSSFRRNPYTQNYSLGPTNFYIDGQNMIGNNDTLTRTLNILGKDAIVDYVWSSTSKSVFIKGTFYQFKNPDFLVSDNLL